MTKKPFFKLLSIILTVAVCVSAVFGCFITANAQDTPSYTITGGECSTGVTDASATVDFTVPDGMVYGFFTVDNTNNWYSSLEVEYSGSLADAQDEILIDKITLKDSSVRISFEIKGYDAQLDAIAPKAYAATKFTLKFALADNVADSIKITISDLDFTGIYDYQNYTDSDFTNLSTDNYFKIGCQHEFVKSNDTQKLYQSDSLEYTVYSNYVCSECGETNDYQLVPEIEKEDTGIVVYSGSASGAAAVSLLDANSENSESNPYIIEYPTQLHALAMGALKNTAGEALYDKGAYFKVKDGITAFVMQDASKHSAQEIMALSSGEETYNYFKNAQNSTNSTLWWTVFTGSNGKFSGHFDGNGITIYGICGNTDTTAVFPVVFGNSSFKNFTLKNCYISASSGAGIAALVGKTVNDAVVDTVTFENVTVADNYIAQTGNQSMGASAMIGYCYDNNNASGAANKDAAKIYNCLIYGNKISNAAYTGTALRSGLITECTGNSIIKDVISLGVTPWTLNSGGWYLTQIGDGTITNVYTDASQEEWTAYSKSNANNTVANAQKWNINYAIDVETLKGDAAITTTANKLAENKAANSACKGTDLDWNTDQNPDGIWFAGATGAYPSLLKKGDASIANSTDSNWKLLGANIEYSPNGNFELNFHYEPAYDSDVKLYVANADGEYKSQIITEHKTSSYANVAFSSNAQMFTIHNLSAKDIGIVWLPTIVTTSKTGDKTVYGETEQISVKDYATAVVNGDNVYTEQGDLSDEEYAAIIQKEKSVAAALINYGNAATVVLSTSKPTTTASEYTGTPDTALAGSGTVANPFIIKTADEFAAVALGYVASKDASGNAYYFEVADGVKAFYINGGATVADYTTSNDVKSYFTSGGSYNNWEYNGSGSDHFYGKFNGNGVTVYGIYSNTYYGGLFPKAGGGAVIENIAIKNSYISSQGMSAAIVGKAYINNSGETYTAGYDNYILNINNTEVVNNVIINTSTTQVYGGVVVAYVQQDALNVTNCIVYGNDADFTNLDAEMSLFAHGGAKSGATTVRVKNLIALGHTFYGGSHWTRSADTGTYQNVYSDMANTMGNFSGSKTTYNLNQIDDVTTLQGSAVEATATALDWNNIWLCGKSGEYPSISLKNRISATSEYSGTPDTTLAGSGTVADPFIIKTADEFAAVALGYVASKDASGNAYYFEVADGVKAFYINGGATVANYTTSTDVKSYFTSGGSYKNWAYNGSGSDHFYGKINGNGVTVYGLYSNGNFYSGLFPKAGGGAVIENIAIKNSYISSQGMSAAIVGKAYIKDSGETYTAGYDNCILNINNIEVVNNVIINTSTTQVYGGVVTAYVQLDALNVTNCIVYGNDADFTNLDAEMSLFAHGGAKSGATTVHVTNLIALGHTFYGGSHWTRSADTGTYKNVYSDMANTMGNFSGSKTTYNLNQIDDVTALQGANAVTTASALDWDNIWLNGRVGEYPSILISDSVSATSKYSGTPDTTLAGSGTAADPFIIKTADEFAAVALGYVASKDASGNAYYFEVADGVKAFYINGGETVAAYTTSNDVKSYFTSGGSYKNWVYNGSGSDNFYGKFNGNGVTVYGIYLNSYYGGLFPKAGGGAVIENIAIKNSYISSQGMSGAIVGRGYINDSGETYTAGYDNYILNINNTEVVNNVIINTGTTQTFGGVVTGYIQQDALNVTNCIVYGNDADFTNLDAEMSLFAHGGAKSGATTVHVKNLIALGHTFYGGSHWTRSADTGTYQNVYSDMANTMGNFSGSKTTYNLNQIDDVTTLQGANAAEIVNALNTANGESIWRSGSFNEYPTFNSVASMPSNVQSMYDAMAFDKYDDYGDSEANFGMYAVGLNLKANPYFAFNFAFAGEYKRSSNVVVTFKSGDTVIETVTAADMINQEAAGRYHLYYLKSAPVTALATGITVTVSYNGGPDVDFGTYSAEGFILEVQRSNRLTPSEYYKNCEETAKAILFYAEMLIERYGA